MTESGRVGPLFHRERASALMAEAGVDMVLATRRHSVAYLTDRHGIVHWDYPFVAHCLERMDDGCRMPHYYVGLPREMEIEPFVVSHRGALPRTDKDCWIKDIRSGCEQLPKWPTQVVAEVLKERNLDKSGIGVEMDYLGVRQYEELRIALPNVDWRDATHVLRELRIIKSSEEIGRMRRAYQMAEAIYQEVLNLLPKEPTVSEVRELKMSRALSFGCPPLDFGYVKPGHFGGEIITDISYRIRPGDIVQLDIGLVHEGYLTDFARTVSVGQPHQDVRRAYEVLEKAFKEMASFIQAGVRAQDVYQAGLAALKSSGGPALRGLGHGLGRECHEPPVLAAHDDTVLAQGMVLVIELYSALNGAPLHLENAGVVTEKGWEPLTRFDTGLIVI